MALSFFRVTSLSRKRRADGLNVHPFATFYIWNSAGSGLETIYRDVDGLIEKENPFLTDKNGDGGFYLDPETSIQVQPAGGAKQPAVTPPVNPILFDDTTPLSLTSSRSLPYDESQAESRCGCYVREASSAGCYLRYQPFPGNTLNNGIGRESIKIFYDLTEDDVPFSFVVKANGEYATDSYFACENAELVMTGGTGAFNYYFETANGHYGFAPGSIFGGAPSYVNSDDYRFWEIGTNLYCLSPDSFIYRMEPTPNPTPPNANVANGASISSQVSFIYDNVVYLVRYDLSESNNTYTSLNSTTMATIGTTSLGSSNYMDLNSTGRRNDATFDNNGNLWIFSKAQAGLLYNLYLFDPSTLTVLKSWEGIDLGTTTTPNSVTIAIFNARLYACLAVSNELHILDIPTL